MFMCCLDYRMASRRGGRTGRGGVRTPYEREAAYINLLERMTNVVESIEQKHMAPTHRAASALLDLQLMMSSTFERAGLPRKARSIEADIWMKRMKKIFDVLEDEQRKAKSSSGGYEMISEKPLSILKFETYAEILDRATIYEKEAEIERFYAKRTLPAGGMYSQDHPWWTDVMYQECVVEVSGNRLVVDLVLLDMGDFDVILGMDSRPSTMPRIDCF
ncbi:hypothetical protein Nepgr_026739 [Nepenthes gracilis]|uniref:Uncharacterized protein n=1 Tax=Nepenthes gracilis TaxID=150966 RepID=A0AAD3T934_NEPGR|nr:hypothetical protein Nepgr_026739 [Nepenthes gracilis]